MGTKAEFAFDVCWEVYRGAREVLETKRGVSALDVADAAKFLWRPDIRPRLDEYVADFALAGQAALRGPAATLPAACWRGTGAAIPPTPLKSWRVYPSSSPPEVSQRQSKAFVMTLRTILRAALVLLAISVGLALYLEWRAARRERRQLAEQLAAAEKILADAQERQKARDAELHDTLAQLAEQKRRTKSPEDIVRALTRELALPKPVILAPAAPGEKPESAGQPRTFGAEKGSGAQGPQETPQGAVPSSESAPAPIQSGPAQIPAEDLKPLFDFVIDCKACQSQLSAAQGNLADERAKNAALVTERDAALKAAKGGGFWRRVRRAAKWFVIGAAAGAIATAAAR